MDSYEKLRLTLDSHPSGAPKSEAFDQILRLLVDPEEAAVAAVMGFSPRPAETIAAACGIPTERVKALLEGMADRAVVFGRVKEGNRAYALLRAVSDQDIPHNDPAMWERWWAANKKTFVVRKPSP